MLQMKIVYGVGMFNDEMTLIVANNTINQQKMRRMRKGTRSRGRRISRFTKNAND